MIHGAVRDVVGHGVHAGFTVLSFFVLDQFSDDIGTLFFVSQRDGVDIGVSMVNDVEIADVYSQVNVPELILESIDDATIQIGRLNNAY